MNTQFVVSLSLLFSASIAQAQCPANAPNYVSVGSKCLPVLPMVSGAQNSEFYRLPSSDPNAGYPVCGKNSTYSSRIPVSADGLFTVYDVSSTYMPASDKAATFTPTIGGTPATMEYSWLYNGDPRYHYHNLQHCACVGGPALPRSTIPSGNHIHTDPAPLSPQVNGAVRMYPDTYDKIIQQNINGFPGYGLVAITNDPTLDGRRGDLFQNDRSQCGCPNINEVPVLSDPTAQSGSQVGTKCVSVVKQAHRVLAQFQSNIEDISGASIVVNRGVEMLESPTPNPLGGSGNNSHRKVLSSFLLPTSSSDMASTTLYNRRIWMCASPYELSATPSSTAGSDSLDCSFTRSLHTCGQGSDGRYPVVSSLITGAKEGSRFDNTVNKKLACCMNEFAWNRGIRTKFDCIDNSGKINDFNSLWASADSSNDGGQMNALVLANSSGKPITGFYSLDGNRCNQYSEFGGALTPATISNAGTVTYDADPYPLPTTDSYLTLQSKLPDFIATTTGKSIGTQYPNQTTSNAHLVPTTVAEMRQCPVLVRAAIVASCPSNPPMPGVQNTITDAGVKRCAFAGSIQVHLRVEQLYKFENQAPIKTSDTVADNKLVSTVSVMDIIRRKNGGSCRPGARAQGGSCVY